MHNYKKISKQIDMPVISEKDGQTIGTISDILFDRKSMGVAGYVVAAGKIIRFSRFLKVENIKGTTSREVVIESPCGFSAFAPAKNNSSYISYMREIKGLTIIKNGMDIGRVSDLLYNAELSEIACFEVSDGFSEDVLYGRNYIANNDAVFGNNNIEVRD